MLYALYCLLYVRICPQPIGADARVLDRRGILKWKEATVIIHGHGNDDINSNKDNDNDNNNATTTTTTTTHNNNDNNDDNNGILKRREATVLGSGPLKIEIVRVEVARTDRKVVARKRGSWVAQLVWSRFTLNSLHVQALMLTDAQAPFLGTPLVPLERMSALRPTVSIIIISRSSSSTTTTTIIIITTTIITITTQVAVQLCLGAEQLGQLARGDAEEPPETRDDFRFGWNPPVWNPKGFRVWFKPPRFKPEHVLGLV